MSLPTPWKVAIVLAIAAWAFRDAEHGRLLAFGAAAVWAWLIGRLALEQQREHGGARRFERLARPLVERCRGEWRPRKRHVIDRPFALFKGVEGAWTRHHLTAQLPGGVSGLDDARIEVFEYSWRPRHARVEGLVGERTSVGMRRFATCAQVDVGVWMASVTITPERAIDRVGHELGIGDLDFEDARFSALYAVRAAHRRAAHELIGSAWLQLLGARPGWTVETSGTRLLLWRGERAAPETFAEAFDLAIGLVAGLPRSVINGERQRRGLPPVLDAGDGARASAAVLERLDQGRSPLPAAADDDFARFRAAREAS